MSTVNEMNEIFRLMSTTAGTTETYVSINVTTNEKMMEDKDNE